MNPVIAQELEQNKSRLNFYFQAKEKTGTKKHPVLDKWIEIYAERVQRLERQLQKEQRQQSPGLRTEIAAIASRATTSAKSARRARAH